MFLLCLSISNVLATVPDTVSATPDELWQYALEHSNIIMAENSRMLAIVELQEGVGRLSDPMLRLTWAPLPIETRNGPIDFTFMLVQKVPWIGLLSEQRTRASIMVEMAEVALYRRELSLRTTIVTKLTEIISTESSMDFLEDEKGRYYTILQIAESLYETGKIPLSKIYSIENHIALLEASLNTHSLRLEVLNDEMLNIIGGNQSTVIIREEGLSELGVYLFRNNERISIETSPAIAEKALQIELSNSEERISTTAGLPMLEAGVTWSVIGNPSVEMGAVEPGADAIAVFAGISLPLGYSGAGYRTAAAQHSTAAAQYEYLQEVRDIEVERDMYISVIAGKYFEYRTMTETIIPNLESIISLTEATWISGTSSLEEMMKVTGDLSTARNELIEIYIEMMIAQARLVELCGVETMEGVLQ